MECSRRSIRCTLGWVAAGEEASELAAGVVVVVVRDEARAERRGPSGRDMEDMRFGGLQETSVTSRKLRGRKDEERLTAWLRCGEPATKHAMPTRGRQGNHTSTPRRSRGNHIQVGRSMLVNGVLLSYQLLSWYGWCSEFCHGSDSDAHAPFSISRTLDNFIPF